MSKKRDLASLLGVYIDDEKEIISLYDKLIDSGITYKVPFKEISLSSNFLQNLFNRFFIAVENSNLRKRLNKPLLFADEIYSINLSIKAKGEFFLSIPLDYKQPQKLSITKDNIKHWSKVLDNQEFFVTFKRIKKGNILNTQIKKELLDNEEVYADFLKEKILNFLKLSKNNKLLAHRLELWGYSNVAHNQIPHILSSLPKNDLGIKDVVLLRKIWNEINLNISNEDLIKGIDPEISEYQKRLKEILHCLENNKPLVLDI